MVSIVIPTYNRADKIERSIYSVLNQTYTDLELLVVDDGSTDDTRKVVEEIAAHDNRVRYVYQENNGACAARNHGISLAKGEYIAFQDSDDEWRKDKLEIQLADMGRYNADVCFCQMQRFNYGKEQSIFPIGLEKIVPTEKMLSQSFASTQTILSRASVFQKHKFDESVRQMQDWDWVIRAAQEYTFCFVDQALVNVYLQNDSISNVSSERRLKNTQYLYKKYENLFDKYPDLHATMLEIIAHCKTLLTSKYVSEYALKYKITKSKKDFVKNLLSKIGVLHVFYVLKK